MKKKRWKDKDVDYIIDEFVIPLANLYLGEKNHCNIVFLSRKAAEWLDEKETSLKK